MCNKCSIDPQNTQGSIQRPRTWPGVDTTDPESGRKGEVVERFEVAAPCPESDQGVRA